MKKLLSLIALNSTLLAGLALAAPAVDVAKEVRHELVMLPDYTVFDNLSYQVNGSTVTLLGSVTQPVVKSDAEAVVKRVEGVDRVINKIQVLPLSPFDDQIRVAAFRAIYSDPTLNRYAIQAVPAIHIIVNNGSVTLEGVVADKFDSETAYMKARQVPGVFSVTNHLQLENAQTSATRTK